MIDNSILDELYNLDLGEGDTHWTLNNKYIHIQKTELVYDYEAPVYITLTDKNKHLFKKKKDLTKVVYWVECHMCNYETPKDCILHAIAKFKEGKTFHSLSLTTKSHKYTCPSIKRYGESCPRNNNCNYPNCLE